MLFLYAVYYVCVFGVLCLYAVYWVCVFGVLCLCVVFVCCVCVLCAVFVFGMLGLHAAPENNRGHMPILKRL